MSKDALKEALGQEATELIDRIIANAQKPPKGEIPIEDPVEECPDDPQKAPAPFSTVSRFGWVKERHPWGIRVDFRPCSVGGLTDVFAQNLVDIQDVGWRGCSSGGSWYKSIIRYRT